MKEFATTVVIDAPPEAVWRILIDGAAYPTWNPEILQVDGRIDRGERITAQVRLGSGGRPMLPLILESVGNRQPEVDAFCAALKRHAEGLIARARVGQS